MLKLLWEKNFKRQVKASLQSFRKTPAIGSEAHRHENKMIELWGDLSDSVNLKMNIKSIYLF